jgi:hypothetical protein
MRKRNKSNAESEKNSHEDMRGRLASHVIEGIARGEKAILEGRLVTHQEAKRRMSRWLR